MPSPFPGMDPYLEGSAWSNFHAQLSAEIARQLAPQLRPRYVALMMQYFVSDTPDNLLISTINGTDTYIRTAPDVGIAKSSDRAMTTRTSAVATQEAPLEIVTVMPERVPQYAIEIRDVDERTLVTLIEVLSPANKRGEGYTEYLEKRGKLLLSTAHLLEIDLLRKGKRVPMRQTLPAAPYFIFLSRYQKRPITDTWPLALTEALPVIPVPLLSDDADVSLDLQAAFTSVYDTLGFDLLLDYTEAPDTPLEDKEAKWAREILEKARHL